jgi:hypothetical protein
VEPLRGHPQVDAPVLGRNGEAALWSERCLILHRRLVVALHPDIGFGRVGLPVNDVDVPEHVAEVVHLVPVGTERVFHVRDGGQRLVVDLDQLGSIARLLECLGRNDGHRLALVPHDVRGEHGLVGELETVRRLSGDVGGSQYRVHARSRIRARHVDRADARRGIRAPKRGTDEHPLDSEVAPVRERSRDLWDSVDATCALADAPVLESGRGSGATGREAYRVDDLLVAGAPAEVPGECLADLVLCRRRVALEQVCGRDEQARSAEPALNSARREERVLQ